MKKYRVTIPYSTLISFEVEAEDEDQAIARCDELSLDDGDENWLGRDDTKDIEVEELGEAQPAAVEEGLMGLPKPKDRYHITEQPTSLGCFYNENTFTFEYETLDGKPCEEKWHLSAGYWIVYTVVKQEPTPHRALMATRVA